MKMDRTLGVGGSDLEGVFNTGYGCTRRLWYEKRDIDIDYPFTGNQHTARGLFYEPIVAKLYQKKTKTKLSLGGQWASKEYPFLVGHPDRIVAVDGSPLEIKCPSLRTFKKIQNEGVPEYYILQLQHYINLLDAETGNFAIFCSELPNDLLTFEIPRDQVLIDKIIEASKEFWEKVLKAIEPDRLESATDRRCMQCAYRITCRGDEPYPYELPEFTNAIVRPDLTELVQEYQAAKAIEKEAEEYVSDVACRLKQSMGDAQMVGVNGARVYLRPYEQWRINTKALKDKYPAIAKEFEIKSIITPLKVYNI